MNSARILFVSLCVFVLAGCLPGLGSSSGPANGGVARSTDGGILFEKRNVISEELSLIKQDVKKLLIDPLDSDRVYIGTQNNGIYTSANAGETWEKMSFLPQQIDSIAIDPRDSRVIYVAASWENRGSLFRTSDAGETWDRVYIEPVAGTRVTAVTLQPQNPDNIFIGTSINGSRSSAVVHSSDAGKTWKNVRTNISTVVDIFFDPVNGRQMYLHTVQNDVLRSDNEGSTWESITTLRRDDGQEKYSGTIYSFYVHPRNPGELYVGTDVSLYKSVNYGDSWEELDIIGSTKGIPIRAVAVSPHDSDRIAYASAKALYVLVGDDRWTITDTESNQAVRTIVYDGRNSDVMYIGFYNVKR